MRTIQQYLAAARARLRDAGVPDAEAEMDARLLAQKTLGWDAARLLTAIGDEAPDGFAGQYAPLVDRRAAREPVAYILGTQEFWGMTFIVTPAVLIPRPESEIIVEAAIELYPDRDRALQIADVGTGSGCLAVALAAERPKARIVAIDISDRALDVAAANAKRHRVDDRVALLHANLLEGSLLDPFAFDLIVSNPPYVPESDRAGIPPEVRDHEPSAALFAGPDGLDVIRELVRQSVGRLSSGGYLVFEIGMGQADRVSELIASTPGLAMVELRKDLQGIPRTAIIQHVM